MKFRTILFSLGLLLQTSITWAQSVETGIVKAYNGAEEKTPLAGVEVNVAGSPSAVSDGQGRFELHFAVLKPGQAVKYNEIYKLGYIVFNKEALDIWRISNNKIPFMVVMCPENEFRALKKKFYGIIEKSYRDDYLRQKKIAEVSSANEMELKDKLKQLEKDYQEKLSNINTYVEIFARIDRSEMDDKISRALQWVEEGKIDEGIRLYEELELIRQTDEQLKKWKVGKRVVQAGQTMMQDAQQDLILMADKLRQQVALYEMGGFQYDGQRIATTHKLVEIYRLLHQAFPNEFIPQLGQWLCREGEDSRDPDIFLAKVTEAAQLPSYLGLIMLGNLYEYRSVIDVQYLEKAKECYQKALPLIVAEDSSRYAERRLNSFYDFVDTLTGHPIYYKILSSQEKTVCICTKSVISYNDPSGDLVLPEFVKYKGVKYRLVSIGDSAFKNNKQLVSVTLPKSVVSIGDHAFAGCFSLKSVQLGENIESIGEGAMPVYTSFLLLANTQKLQEGLYHLIYERCEFLGQNRSNDEKVLSSTYHLIDDLLKDKNTIDDYKPFYWFQKGNLLAHSSFSGYHPAEAIVCYKQALKRGLDYAIFRIGVCFYLDEDYQNAYHFFVQAANKGIPEANNRLAYMYAQGKQVKQDFKKALEYIDKAIVQDSTSADFIDSKGEIYLMMGQRDKAAEYWNKAIAIDPEFDKNNSELYKGLYGVSEKKLPDTQKNLKKYITIAQAMARTEYERFFNACEIPEYEELLSIAIIAVQVMVNNKTPEELEKYNMAYMATAMRWAIQNELGIRYKWYNQIIRHQNTEIRKGKKLFAEKKLISLAVYQTMASLYSHLYLFEDNDFQLEIEDMGKTLTQVIDSIPASHRDLARQIIFGQKFVSDLAREQGKTFEEYYKNIVPILNFLKQFIGTDGRKIEYDKKASLNSNAAIIFDTVAYTHAKRYIDIIQVVAKIEQKNLMDHNQNFVEYEELLAIGIIALQALKENKTLKGLEKYNDIYIATSIHWAIQNELTIRYKWYNPVRFGKLLNKTENIPDSVKSEFVNTVSWQTAGAMYNRRDSIDNNSLRLEIERIGNVLLTEIAQMPAFQRQLVQEIVFHQKELEEVAQVYGIRVEDCLKSLSPLWKKMKEILKQKNP